MSCSGDGFRKAGTDLMIEYKGFIARVEYDASVDRLHGSVINSGPYPIATFEATDVQRLRRVFRRSIGYYLAWCEQDGVEPRRPSPATHRPHGFGNSQRGGGNTYSR